MGNSLWKRVGNSDGASLVTDKEISVGVSVIDDDGSILGELDGTVDGISSNGSKMISSLQVLQATGQKSEILLPFPTSSLQNFLFFFDSIHAQSPVLPLSAFLINVKFAIS